jgi:hypothetical protein
LESFLFEAALLAKRYFFTLGKFRKRLHEGDTYYEMGKMGLLGRNWLFQLQTSCACKVHIITKQGNEKQKGFQLDFTHNGVVL